MCDNESAKRFRIQCVSICLVLLAAATAFGDSQADPGGPYSIHVGQDLFLDGTGSTTLHPPILSYQWDIRNDGTFDFTGPQPAIPWIELAPLLTEGADYPADHDTGLPNVSVRLRVTDSSDSTSDSVAVLTIYPNEPTAILDVDPNPASVAQMVTLDTSRSHGSSPDCIIETRTLQIYKGSILLNTLQVSNYYQAIEYSFMNSGTYTAVLTVTDYRGCSDTDSVSIVVTELQNTPPVSLPGGPYIVNIGSTLVLDGSSSYDPDEAELGDWIARYEWDLNNDETYDLVTYFEADARISWASLSELLTEGVDYPASVFTRQPYVPIRLKVTDSFGASHIAQTYLRVYEPSPTASMDVIPHPCTAGQPVTFDARRSHPGTPHAMILGRTWRVYRDGSLIETLQGERVNYTFQQSGNYAVSLTIINNTGTADTATQEIAVIPPADHYPLADPGGPYVLFCGRDLTLDGSASFDPDAGDEIVLYEWDLNGDGACDVAGGLSQTQVDWPTLSACLTEHQDYPADPATGEPRIQVGLRVTDSTGLKHSSTTRVTIYSDRPTAVAEICPQPSETDQDVMLDGSNSYGSPFAGAEIVSWTWNIYYAGSLIDTLEGMKAVYAFPVAGTYAIELSVQDGGGRAAALTASHTVTGVFNLAGDLNNDYKVDLADLAVLVQNWLIDCTQDPYNPECIPR